MSLLVLVRRLILVFLVYNAYPLAELLLKLVLAYLDKDVVIVSLLLPKSVVGRQHILSVLLHKLLLLHFISS